MLEETIKLREAARRLARIRNPKGNNIESSRLLGVMQSGDLKAGFYVMDGMQWIEIPSNYWRDIDSRKFRIGRRHDDQKSGSYAIKGAQFSDQLAVVIHRVLKQSAATSAEHQVGAMRDPLITGLDSAAKSHEVLVRTAEFDDYRRRQGLEEEKTVGSNVGARRKEGWRELCSYMAAYFAAFQRNRAIESLKIDHAKDEILAAAKNGGVADLPKADTIKEQISKAKGLLESDIFKFKI